GGGAGMSNGVTLAISVYYRSGANLVTLASTTVTNSKTLFPTNTHLADFSVIVPAVKATDPWAGKSIGIQIASTVGFDLQGGYWDLDNVRLTSATASTSPQTSLTGSDVIGGQFHLTLTSAPGRYEILSSADVAAPLSSWTSLGVVTNVTGSVLFTDTNQIAGNHFYRARSAQ
ncbi:MAG TPA: hypothetical protein VHH73_13125, partial [Verrucomicrobiae bacterium]|nr:hypothetical protein [Verrucomicrobiae bacterium]